jgi:PAS domain-containing protein
MNHRLRMFENRVLRRMFGLKRDEVIGRGRKLHNEELHNLYSSPCIIRMIESRRMRWTGHVARMGKRGMHIGYLWESQKERDHQEDLDICGRITREL